MTRNVAGLELCAIISTLSLAGSLTLMPSPLISAVSSAMAVGSFGLSRTANRKDEVERLERDLAAVRQERYQLSEQWERGKAYNADLTLKVQEMHEHADTLLANCKALHVKLETANRQAETATDSYRQVELELEAKRSQLLSFGQQFDEQNAELLELEREVARLTVELSTHTQHKELLVYQQTHSVQDKLSETLEALRVMESTAQAMGVDLSTYHDGLQSAQQALEYLSNEGYNDLKASHVEAVRSLAEEVQRLRGQLTAELAPKLFGVPGEYTRADKLIELLDANGHLCDANELTPNNDGSYSVALNVRDRSKLCSAYVDELTKLGDYLATQVNALEPLRFELDRINPFRVQTTIRFAAKPKATTAAKLPWRTAEQFVSLAGKWQRVRVTGGSESGKSPLAELIVAAMQRSKPELRALLAFPLTDSVKNHWQLHVTHNSLTAAAKETLKAKQLTVCVLDECDTQLESERELAATVKELLKTGSHKNVGCVLCGQNANVKQWKGFDRSDFTNCINVHIGANAYHAITNSNELTPDEQVDLKAKADKLTRYAETENATIDDPAMQVRWALVMEPSKRPYFIELPKLGSLAFDYTLSASTPNATNLPAQPGCPKCGHEHASRNGTTPQGKQRLKCKSCNANYTVEV